MKKIMIIGNAPLPYEKVNNRPAAGLRTYQFLKPLIDKKDSEVLLVAIAMPECYGKKGFDNEETHENYICIRISKDDIKLMSKIQKIHDKFKPDVVLGVNTFPSYVASQLKSSAPFWADLNGWILAEAQAQANKMNSDAYLSHYLGMEKNILRKADKFSAVSLAQKQALYGELALVGRLNKYTFGYNFVEHIPNGTEISSEDIHKGNVKEKFWGKVPENAFTALWVGGYNTWVDENTLFEGVEKAMEKCDDLYFVSTGGNINGLDNVTFKNFLEKVENSSYKNRFVFLGWVDTKDIPYIYRCADVGLNVDKFCLETLTGARNRINEMMKFGLPVVTTLGSEISYEIENCGAGFGIESGNSEELSKKLLDLYKLWKNGQINVFGENGKKYIEEKCNYKVALKPFLNWIESFSVAPDKNKLPSSGKIVLVFTYLKNNGIKKTWQKFLQKLRGNF